MVPFPAKPHTSYVVLQKREGEPHSPGDIATLQHHDKVERLETTEAMTDEATATRHARCPLTVYGASSTDRRRACDANRTSSTLRTPSITTVRTSPQKTESDIVQSLELGGQERHEYGRNIGMHKTQNPQHTLFAARAAETIGAISTVYVKKKTPSNTAAGFIQLGVRYRHGQGRHTSLLPFFCVLGHALPRQLLP